MQVELPLATLEAAANMVYRRWSEEYDYLKKVREEQYDGSKDWKAFHAARLKHHTAKEAAWCRHKDLMVRALKKAVEAFEAQASESHT